MKANLFTLAATALGISAAWAQEPQPAGATTTGAISAGALVSGDSSNNPWKLREYRDLNDGVVTGIEVKRRSPGTYLDVYGENLGRNDQAIDLKGGRYGSYKYQLFDSRLVHNWTFNARSPYAGIGGSTLTATFPQANPDTWSTFDLRKKRENAGGNFELWGGSPWFVRVDANEVRERGLQLIAGANGTNPGPGFADKAFPLDYTTRNASIETGYATRREQVSISLSYSSFANDNETLRWTNPFFGPASALYDTTWLPPSNDYTKIGLNGMLKQLPFGSTLAGRLTLSQTRSATAIPAAVLAAGATLQNPNPDRPNFDGNVLHKTASVSLHSSWTRATDSRIYWNWFRRDNESSEVIFTPTAASGLRCGGGPCVTELLSYNKNNIGAEVGHRVNSTNRLIFGADYVNLNRNRVDFDNTKDYRGSVEWRNTSSDWLATRVKFQHLQRRSHFIEGDAGAGPADPQFLNRFIRRFDAANVDQELFKVGADLQPAELTDLGLEFIWKYNKYKDTVLGRLRDDRSEIYASAAHGDPKKLRVMIFGDIEYVKYDSFHRTVSGAAGTGNYDPGAGTVLTGTGNFNWQANNLDRSWLVGIGADWLPREALKLSGSLIWQWTHGTVDFSTPQGIPATATPLVPIENFDNTRRFTANIKGTYTASRRWDLTAGYAHEKLSYSDIALDSYRYVVGTAPNASYLSGAYAFPNYSSNLAYLVATMKF